jgi:hypothetical protein
MVAPDCCSNEVVFPPLLIHQRRVRALGRKLDWLRLRDYLAHADRGRELMEMVIYAGLPPPQIV